MNMNNSPNVEQLRDLLRREDDHAGHHVLWVKKDGTVELTCVPKVKPFTPPPPYEHAEMQLRYETFLAGNEYVSPEAAEHAWWTSELFRNLVEQWVSAKGKTEVTGVELHTVAPDGHPLSAEEIAFCAFRKR